MKQAPDYWGCVEATASVVLPVTLIPIWWQTGAVATWTTAWCASVAFLAPWTGNILRKRR